jgi:hypothetical protein
MSFVFFWLTRLYNPMKFPNTKCMFSHHGPLGLMVGLTGTILNEDYTKPHQFGFQLDQQF